MSQLKRLRLAVHRRRGSISMVESAPRLVVAGLCCIALRTLACVGEVDRPPPEPSTFTILQGGDEWALGPQADDYPQHLVFLSLARLNENGEPQPRLAESWEHSEDYREWTIRLRRDVRWHDGVPVTAHDVLFSMELWTHPEVLYWTVGPIQSSSIEDDYMLTVTFSKPTMKPLDGWSSIYPRHLLEGLDPSDYYGWEFWTQPVGNGPYRYARHIPRTMMELEANPDYYLGKPRIQRVVLKFTQGAMPLVELLSGNVDAIRALSQMDVLKVTGDPRFRAYRNVNPSQSRVLAWNHRHPLFQDVQVRRALTLAVDRRKVHQVLNLPEQTPIYDGIFTLRQYRRGELGDALHHDVAKAQEMLEAAGWRDMDGDGIRERDGEEARFTVLAAVAVGGTLRTTERVAIAIQQELREVGVRVDVQPLGSSLVGERFRTGEFEATLPRFFTNPATTLSRGWFGPGSPIGYHHPELVRLLETADGTADPEARDSLYRAMQEIFRADLPVLFLYPFGWTSVIHRRVRGLSRRSPVGGDLFEYMEELWLEEEAR